MTETDRDQRVAAVRRFNRFYTRQIGVLQEGYLDSPFSLAEVRVLYELAHRQHMTASDLVRDLGLDAGYLSRIIRGFKKQGLIAAVPSATDGRRRLLSLTEQGREVFAPLHARSHHDIGVLLDGLSPATQNRLLAAMHTIEDLLGATPEPRVPYLLRSPYPGDLGWVVHRHGVLYAEEYAWDEHFEALVATIVAGFIEKHDPKRERCWIAERDGAIVGSVLLVQQSSEVAKLRLLLVEPGARGLGIGARLVAECERFARIAGYQTITLWTNDVLHAARHIYERAGYRLVHQEPHHSFGHDLIGETWELDL